MSQARLTSSITAVCRWCTLLALALSPTQWSLIHSPRVGIADLLLALAAALMGFDIVLNRSWSRLWRTAPHWSSFVLVATVAIAATTTANRGEAIKELIQLTEYFIIAVWLFNNLLHPADNKNAPHSPSPALIYTIMGTITTIILLLATLQYLAPAGHPTATIFIEPKSLDIIANRLGGMESPLLVCGTFSSRNVLGGYLTLATPLFMAALINRKLNWGWRLASLIVILAVLSLTLTGPCYWAIAAAIAALAALQGIRWFIPAAALLILWQAQVLPNLPRENDILHFESAALYEPDGTPARRYPEWQAAANMLLEHPWTGCGPGIYQEEIGPYYGTIPNATGPAEPDIQNLYLVVASSCGIPALLALITLFTTAIATALRHKHPGPALALAAFAAASIWHPLLVRGIGIPLAFVLALAHLPAHQQVKDPKPC